MGIHRNILALGAVAALTACSGENAEETARIGAPADTEIAPVPPTETVSGASAELLPASGQQAAGRLLFVQENGGVRIRGDVTGLRPGGTHGFHVHEIGDCSAPDAASAGEHFNPTGQQHGHPEGAAHHAGDLFNLEANAAGNAAVDVLAAGLTVGSGSNDVIGRAVIVHESPDDYTSQPAGNSGDRIACGIIE